LSEETIFDQSTNEDQTVDTSITTNQLPTEVLDFVGDGKKYSSVEDALKSVPHAQKHIQNLEAELAVLKEEVVKRRTTEELLDEIKSGILPHEETPQQVGLDKEELANVVNRTIEFREAQKRAKENTQSVANKFREKFGDTAQAAYETLAKESGLSVQQLNTLASTSPNAVLKLAGLSGTTTTIAAKTTGSINTEAMASTNNGNSNLSARVPKGATTKDLVSAWRAAGDKVKQQTST
jgi:hypothetical protein